MISKEDFKSLVETVCLSKKMTQGQLSKDMNYGENYISEMLTEKGKLTEKFVSAFKIKYKDILENPKTPSGKSFENLTETILILSRNNERLARILEANSIEIDEASAPSEKKNAQKPDHEERKEDLLGKPKIRYEKRKRVYKKRTSG